MMAIPLITLLMSCASGKVVYKDRIVVPSVNYPEFPVLEDAEREKNNRVSVPDSYIVRLAEFKIRYEECVKTYTELRAVYSDIEENEK